METLFEIETDRLHIRWQGPPDRPHVPAGDMWPGRLRVVPIRPTSSLRVFRRGLPPGHEQARDLVEGPRLFEETQYHVWACSKDGSAVRLVHRDPQLLAGVNGGLRHDVLAGTVNFHGQVGRSLFGVELDGVPVLEFEVEVFPSKLDYRRDFDAMLAEISHIMTALALEYLRATYRFGAPRRAPSPTDVEWLTLLDSVMEQLEQAIRQIQRRPARRLAREPRPTRLERCRRIDSGLRRAILQGRGSGQWMVMAGPIEAVRERVLERRPAETLDTPEHRWLRAQLAEIRNRLLRLATTEQERWRRSRVDRRARAAVEELRRMESRVAALLEAEPIAMARGEPPAGFSSLLLQQGPGYREAYRAILTLRLGLRLEGGPLRLSLKEIDTLYEYWCYLAVLEILREELGAALPAREFVRVSARGLRVDLERGRTKQVRLAPLGRRGVRAVTVSFNPSYQTPTGMQRPDMTVAIEVEGWRAPFEILLDAKYRVDASPEYVERHGTPGPPEDAVNALHRYRDAILDRAPDAEGPQHRIIMGAALFPLEDPEGAFRTNTFYGSLERVGIGALPFVPSQTDYVREWLRQLLRRSGWAMADRAVAHRTVEERRAWQREAAEAVLIAVLRPGVDQLEWIRRTRLYYAPLHRLGPRRFVARWIAFYEARGDGEGPGAITCEAEVRSVSVRLRREIRTPWRPRHPDELCVVYELGELVERTPPIVVPHGVRSFRWASRLSLLRAQRGEELYLETEPEWRLYEELRARGVPFELRPGDAEVVDPDDIRGRAIFEVGGYRVRYAGAAGFRLDFAGRTVWVSRADELIPLLTSP